MVDLQVAYLGSILRRESPVKHEETSPAHCGQRPVSLDYRASGVSV